MASTAIWPDLASIRVDVAMADLNGRAPRITEDLNDDVSTVDLDSPHVTCLFMS